MPLLFILFIAGIFSGIAVLAEAKSAIHEIAAFLLFVVSAVSLSGGLICGRLDNVAKLLQKKDAPEKE